MHMVLGLFQIGSKKVAKTLGQKIAVGFAYLFYLIGVGCALGAALHGSDSPTDPIKASLMASVVFFVGAGFVLHVVGAAKLKGILSGGDHYVLESDEEREKR